MDLLDFIQANLEHLQVSLTFEMQPKLRSLQLLLLVVDRHKLTVFYLKSFDMDSVQVGKAVFGKEIQVHHRLILCVGKCDFE